MDKYLLQAEDVQTMLGLCTHAMCLSLVWTATNGDLSSHRQEWEPARSLVGSLLINYSVQRCRLLGVSHSQSH